jgi:hypothetical protein
VVVPEARSAAPEEPSEEKRVLVRVDALLQLLPLLLRQLPRINGFVDAVLQRLLERI